LPPHLSSLTFRAGWDDQQADDARGCNPCAPLYDLIESTGAIVVNRNGLSYQSRLQAVFRVETILPDDNPAPFTVVDGTTWPKSLLLTVTDPLGRVTTFDYDGLGRQIKVTQPDPDGPGGQAPAFQATVYDAAGRVLQTSNALGHTTSYAYDPLGRVVFQTDALSGVTSFRYDALGNRLSLTDPVDNTTTWTYDALNRVVQETNELGHSRYFAYNDGGYLTRRIDRRGLVREFQYDTLGRNTAEIWYDTAADAEMDVDRQDTLNFTYDALGRMLSAGDQFAGYAYTYDRLGRMTISDAAIAGLAPTVTLTNAYDAAGRRTQVAAKIGGNGDFVTDYAYDQLGRTTSIRQYASPTSVLPVADKRVDFTYDLANQPVALTRYADLSGNQLLAATDYLFDQAGRLTGMTHSKGASVFADYDWTFDEANRMTRFESLIDGVADYTNDDTGQLTGAEYTAGAGLPTAPPDEQYVYDENGNRVNNGYTVGPNNQLLSDGTYAYTYDEEGNRTSKTSITTGEVTEYTWDHRNRLTRVSTRATANGPLTADIQYAYDFGQRWVRKVFNPGQSDERSTVFVHDGGDEQNPLILHPIRPPQIVLHFDREGAGDASETDLAHRYLWGPNVDQILADEQLDSSQPPAVSSLLWPLTDHLNTVRDMATYDANTNTTTIVNHLTYDAFGNIAAQTAPTIGTLFLFTARPFDKDTGLQNNLNRWYDATTGRWPSEDPSTYKGSRYNLFTYVSNMPATRVDSSGLILRIPEYRDQAYFLQLLTQLCPTGKWAIAPRWTGNPPVRSCSPGFCSRGAASGDSARKRPGSESAPTPVSCTCICDAINSERIITLRRGSGGSVAQHEAGMLDQPLNHVRLDPTDPFRHPTLEGWGDSTLRGPTGNDSGLVRNTVMFTLAHELCGHVVPNLKHAQPPFPKGPGYTKEDPVLIIENKIRKEHSTPSNDYGQRGWTFWNYPLSPAPNDPHYDPDLPGYVIWEDGKWVPLPPHKSPY